MKSIYVLDHALSWPAFKELHDKFSLNDGGPTPENFDQILWEMLRGKLIYIWLDEEADEPIQIGNKLPDNRQVQVITNGPGA